MKRLINICNVKKLKSVVSYRVLRNVFFGKFSNSLIVDEEAGNIDYSCNCFGTLLSFNHYSFSNLYFYHLVAVWCGEVFNELKILILVRKGVNNV